MDIGKHHRGSFNFKLLLILLRGQGGQGLSHQNQAFNTQLLRWDFEHSWLCTAADPQSKAPGIAVSKFLVGTWQQSRAISPPVLCLPKASFIFSPPGSHHPALSSVKGLRGSKGECGQLLLVWPGSHFTDYQVAFMFLWVSQLRI